MPDPVVSIIICTRNRAKDLRKTLNALGEIAFPGDLPAEVIVVDNGSTDETAEVVSAFQIPGVPVRLVHEPRRGQSIARNSGIAAARGTVLLFTDDDVRPPRDWIAGMCRPIIDGCADAVAGGVHLAPHLERDWMTDEHRRLLAATERLDPQNPGEMVGANMAFSKAVTKSIPLFEPHMGPGTDLAGEETLFSFRLVDAGFRLAGRLDVSVEHHFDPARLARREFLRVAEIRGRTQAFLRRFYHHETISQPYRHLAKSIARLIWLRIIRHKECRTPIGCPLWEFAYLRNIWLYWSWLRPSPLVRPSPLTPVPRGEGHSEMRVSIVVPLYNKAAYVGRALDSICRQTHTDFEVIVVDDGSTDSSASVVRAYPDSRVRLVSQSNAGVSAARNRGIAEARADWIAFLDADDEFQPEFLEKTLRAAVSAGSPPAMVFSNYRMMRREGPVHARVPKKAGLLSDYFRFCAANGGEGACSSCVLVSRAAIKAVGGFPEGVAQFEDIVTWWRLAWLGPVGYVPDVLATYHTETPGSASKKSAGPPPVPEYATVYREAVSSNRIPRTLRASCGRVANAYLLEYAYSQVIAGDRPAARRTLSRQCELRYCRPISLAHVWLLAHLPGECRAWAKRLLGRRRVGERRSIEPDLI